MTYRYLCMMILALSVIACDKIGDSEDEKVNIEILPGIDQEQTKVVLTGEPGASFKVLIASPSVYDANKAKLVSLLETAPLRSFDSDGKYEVVIESAIISRSAAQTDYDITGYFLFAYCNEEGKCNEVVVTELSIILPAPPSGTDQPSEPEIPSDPDPDTPGESENPGLTIEGFGKDPDKGQWAN